MLTQNLAQRGNTRVQPSFVPINQRDSFTANFEQVTSCLHRRALAL